MLCYEIWLNDQKLCICGHESMETIQASLFFGRGMPSNHFAVSAKLNVNEHLKQDARWVSKLLNKGDEIKLVIKECEHPDAPEEIKQFGTKLHPLEEKELFCSFCGESQFKVEKIFAGMAANICLECAKLVVKQP